MKLAKSILLLLLVVSASIAQPGDNRFATSATIDKWLQYSATRQRPLILAHRGGPGPTETENSLVTFVQTSVALPDAILEMDVRMTADSGLVLLHDETLDRESNLTGPVSARRLVDLQAVKLKTLQGQLTNQPMPTLAEVLIWNRNRYMLALDVKPGTDPVLVMQTVTRLGAGCTIFIICYSLADAQRLRERYPLLWLAVGVNSIADLNQLETKPLPLTRLIALTPREAQPAVFYKRLHKLGIPCSIGTYGPGQLDEQPIRQAADQYKTLFRLGGNILTTDRPQEVSDLFKN